MSHNKKFIPSHGAVDLHFPSLVFFGGSPTSVFDKWIKMAVNAPNKTEIKISLQFNAFNGHEVGWDL